MLLVGLTGNIGSGKTTVGRLFNGLGVPVYNADERGRYFLTIPEVKQQVLKLFGDVIEGNAGDIDRKKLAGIVFADENKLEQLNSIIHPLVRKEFRQWANEQSRQPYVVQEAAILVETGFNKELDRLILVTAPEKLRIQRVCERDGVTEEEVKQRARHQMAEKDKLAYAHFIINNDETQELESQVKVIHNQLLRISRSKH